MKRVLTIVISGALLLAGCTDSGAPENATTTGAGQPAAAAGAKIGAKGSPCELPVTFDLAEDYKPKAVKITPGDEFDDALGRKGDLSMACELDAKPAGNIGFLRVWVGDKGSRTPRQALEAFTKDKNVTKDEYTEVEVAGLKGAEVTFLRGSSLDTETKRETTLLVQTKDKTVAITCSGLDTLEHDEMKPAYDLAKKTLAAA